VKLSVIIVNYNVEYFLEQCLNSVCKALEKTKGEVWVVDNNSIDGSCSMVKTKFPQVHLIENKVNTGFSKANNQAIALSKGEYVLLLNPDTVVEEDTFSKTVAFMDAHPEAGGLGVKMIDGKGHFLPESKRGLPTPSVAFYKIFGLSALFPRSRRFSKYHLGYLDKDKTHEIEILSGAFMMMRKSVLDKIGYLDEAFFMYGEDIDMSYRIILAGSKNYYFPETRIIHYKGESTKKSSVNYVFVFYNAMIILQKNISPKKTQKLFLSLSIWPFTCVRAQPYFHVFLKNQLFRYSIMPPL
jgi:GT2 family glycosyltransferase